MLQRRDGVRLALKTLARLQRLDQLRRQHFDRDVATKPRVARAVDLAHAAGTDGSENLVRAEAITCRQGHVCARGEQSLIKVGLRPRAFAHELLLGVVSQSPTPNLL